MIQVKIFYAENDLRNFSYLIVDNSSASSWVIDPFEATTVTDYIKKESLVLKGILNTHQHWDHIRGNSALQSIFKCPIVNFSDQELPLGEGHSLQFLNTPGHTMDHRAFLWSSRGKALALFSGDTLFNSGVGNCKNGGDVDTLYETTMRLNSLPDDVVLYPGHDYVKRNLLFAKSMEPENNQIDEALRLVDGLDTEKGIAWTLGEEKKVNPFLRLSSENLRHHLNMPNKRPENDYELERDLFKQIRALRDNW